MPVYLTVHLFGYIFYVKVKVDTTKEGLEQQKAKAKKRLDKQSKNRHSAQ